MGEGSIQEPLDLVLDLRKYLVSGDVTSLAITVSSGFYPTLINIRTDINSARFTLLSFSSFSFQISVSHGCYLPWHLVIWFCSIIIRNPCNFPFLSRLHFWGADLHFWNVLPFLPSAWNFPWFVKCPSRAKHSFPLCLKWLQLPWDRILWNLSSSVARAICLS